MPEPGIPQLLPLRSRWNVPKTTRLAPLARMSAYARVGCPPAARAGCRSQRLRSARGPRSGRTGFTGSVCVSSEGFSRRGAPGRGLPTATLCMPGCPPRHVCVAERRLLPYLLTYLLPVAAMAHGLACTVPLLTYRYSPTGNLPVTYRLPRGALLPIGR